ncbi:hypothetical protein V3C99_005072, partial [Haemonchus contortus]
MAHEDIHSLLRALAQLDRTYTRSRESRGRRRREHVPFLNTRTKTFDDYLAVFDNHHFQHYTRLSPTEFERLHEYLAPSLQHRTTYAHMHHISSRQRLFIFMRFVGHGHTFEALSKEVHHGRSMVQGIVFEVASAIRSVLYREAFPPFTRQHLEEVANKTQVRYDYPRAAGFMDGKHINIKKPARSGALYYNYKGTHSIILLALVDCDYRILAFDVGAPGRMGDTGVYRRSTIKRLIDNNDHLFPPTRPLGNVGPVQYHILVNCGFADGYRCVRPYTRASVDTPSKRRFNGKHSGAHQTVESTFGMLCRRFGLLQTTIQLEPTHATEVVSSLLVLHNLLIRWRNPERDIAKLPPPIRELDPLEDVSGQEESLAESGVRARELITRYYGT